MLTRHGLIGLHPGYGLHVPCELRHIVVVVRQRNGESADIRAFGAVDWISAPDRRSVWPFG